MSTIEILTIGDELINGSRTNTNATWLAKQVTNLGLIVERIITIGDSVREISSTIKGILNRKPSALLITGGLGPTPDDRTLEAVANSIDRELISDEKATELVKNSYSRLKSNGIVKKEELNESREKMTYIPEGSEPLPNPVGAAPGIHLRTDRTHLFVLPGVPKEMQAIFNESIKDILAGFGGQKKHTETMVIKEGDESMISPLIEKIEEDFPKVELHSYPSEGEVQVVFTSLNSKEVSSAKEAFEDLLKSLN
ncbi:MAG: competence/damage-inducible protein A [Hadesarchaea archaeon]|nr:competence/damage-inducible protein A [Hadesarchaea archaeon]